MVCFLYLLIVHVNACHDDRAFRAKINCNKKNTTKKILLTNHMTSYDFAYSPIKFTHYTFF